MIIISDFSDTIATSEDGSKFPPFELKLGKMLGIDNRDSYEEFIKVRRDNSFAYNDKMKIWLKPFISTLEMVNIENLTSTFRLNPNFFKAVKLIKERLAVDDLKITIVSGTLWQIINSFLSRKEVQEQVTREKILFDIKAAKLIFDDRGKFSGNLEETDPPAYSTVEQYPADYLILGDNAMESYGFGNRLLNVQNYNEGEILSRIGNLP